MNWHAVYFLCMDCYIRKKGCDVCKDENFSVDKQQQLTTNDDCNSKWCFVDDNLKIKLDDEKWMITHNNIIIFSEVRCWSALGCMWRLCIGENVNVTCCVCF